MEKTGNFRLAAKALKKVPPKCKTGGFCVRGFFKNGSFGRFFCGDRARAPRALKKSFSKRTPLEPNGKFCRLALRGLPPAAAARGASPVAAEESPEDRKACHRFLKLQLSIFLPPQTGKLALRFSICAFVKLYFTSRRYFSAYSRGEKPVASLKYFEK